jgi:hypothetical protein
MNFERISKNPFIRDDSYSYEAYYEIEEPNEHINVYADHLELKFIWDRVKSNENITDHGFSHYLTRYFYCDEYCLFNGQKVGKDTVKIKTDKNNKGILCAYDTSTNDNDLPEQLVLIVQQEKLDNDRIRLISCYEIENDKYLYWYHKNQLNLLRKKHLSTKLPYAENAPARLKEFSPKKIKAYEKIQEKILQELVELSKKAAKEFRKQVDAKTFRP